MSDPIDLSKLNKARATLDEARGMMGAVKKKYEDFSREAEIMQYPYTQLVYDKLKEAEAAMDNLDLDLWVAQSGG